MDARLALTCVSIVLSAALGAVVARGGADGAPGRSGGGGPVRGGPAGAEAKVTIGFSLETLKEARWQQDREHFTARAAELGADVLVQSANGDDTRQMQDVRALISSRVGALVIVAHDATAMAGAVDLAHAAGIPVIAYDHMIRKSPVDLYVSFDNVRVGELQAKFVLEHTKPAAKKRIVRIFGAPTDDNAKFLKEGQDHVLLPAIARGEVEIVHEDWAEDWKPENAKKIVNAALTRGDREPLVAVVASNDGTAGGAIQALTEAGLAEKVLVTGQDAELAAAQRIVAGTQAMTVYKPIKKLAAAAAEAAVRLARGRSVIARTTVSNGTDELPALVGDVIVVTRDNLVDTAVRDGFLAFDDVFRGAAEDRRPRRP